MVCLFVCLFDKLIDDIFSVWYVRKCYTVSRLNKIILISDSESESENLIDSGGNL